MPLLLMSRNHRLHWDLDFRCGFLGLLHMEIVQERLDREFDMNVITTVPNVSFTVHTTKGEVIEVHNPSGLPDVTHIDHIEEPYISAQIISQSDYIGSIMKLCIDKRGALKNQVYLTSDRVEVTFEMPLAEIVFDFYDKLKSISKGYASFDYYQIGFQQANLVTSGYSSKWRNGRCSFHTDTSG